MRNLNSFAAAALLLWAAPAGAKVLEDVVATVNGKPLLLSEYKKNVQSVLENYQRNFPSVLRDTQTAREIREKVLEQMVDDEVLSQEGDALKIKVYGRELEKGVEEIQERSFRLDEATGKPRSDAQMRSALGAELAREGLSEEQFKERIRRQLLIRKVVDEKVRAQVREAAPERLAGVYEKVKAVVQGGTESLKGLDLAPEEAQAYLAFGARLRDQISERVRVAHILVPIGDGGKGLVEQSKAKNDARAKAEGLKKRLEGGEDFYELASKASADAESAARGGDLGFVIRGWMPPEFETAAFSLPVGEVSEPVETQFGFHLIRVQEKKAKESLNFERTREELQQFLFNLDFQKELQSFVKSLRAKAAIEIKQPSAD